MTDSAPPSTIFRYHSPNIDRLLGMIQTGNFTIRLAHPSEFNDVNDTAIPINVDPHQKMVREYTQVLESAYCYIYKAQEEANREGIEIDNKELILYAMQKSWYGKRLRLERCRMKKEQADFFRRQLKLHVSNYFKEQHIKLSQGLSSNLGVCCFTTDILSPTMWGYYAKNIGYAFEYDGEKIAEIGKDGYGIHPIIYQPDTTDKTKEFLQILVSSLKSFIPYLDDFEDMVDELSVSEDGVITWGVLEESAKILGNATNTVSKEILADDRTLNLAIKHSLHKSKEWEHEKEWRLLMPLNADAKDDERYITVFPKAIYLGYRMPEAEVQKIMQALHETNSPIKLYQVQPNLMTQKLDIRELR